MWRDRDSASKRPVMTRPDRAGVSTASEVGAPVRWKLAGPGLPGTNERGGISGSMTLHGRCSCEPYGGVGPLLLTPEQVAEALAIGRTRVYAMMASGVLPSVRIGHSRRVTRHVLAQFIQDLCARDDSQFSD
jgi:excisionase family DNA binding protein